MYYATYKNSLSHRAVNTAPSASILAPKHSTCLLLNVAGLVQGMVEINTEKVLRAMPLGCVFTRASIVADVASSGVQSPYGTQLAESTSHNIKWGSIQF